MKKSHNDYVQVVVKVIGENPLHHFFFWHPIKPIFSLVFSIT